VHPSNFVVSGFTSDVSVQDLAGLGVPVVVDIGSGLLAPHPLLPDEPDAATVLQAGASLVTASGDKLLGGPQSGLLLGRREVVDRLRRHPLARGGPGDNQTLAALEATLRGPRTPLAQSLESPVEQVRARVEAVVERLVGSGVDAVTVPSHAVVGGGGAPGVRLPSAAVGLPIRYSESLRRCATPVVGRVESGRCLLDLRSVAPGDDDLVVRAVLDATP
jgi:L-seryl-tRNA(Ser) seleniumtransferase